MRNKKMYITGGVGSGILGECFTEEYDLDDDEIELLNTIRKSGMSVDEFFASMQKSQEVPEKSYKIDQLSDEDVYALDLLEKVGSDNITDEELEQAIHKYIKFY